MTGHDVFKSGGAYENYIGRWSRRLAPVFLEWLDAPAGGAWLDVGCGTGVMTEAILSGAAPDSVTGIDLSPEQVEHAIGAVRDPRVAFAVGSAMRLEFPDATFGAAVAALVLNFVPDPLQAAREMRRVVRARGTVGAFVWDYAKSMAMMRFFWDAATELEPTAARLDEGRRFSICRPGGLPELFAAAGLEAVSERALDLEMVFSGFDDFWTPFLGGQGPAPAYAMSLDEGARGRLRDLIRSRLPFEADGSIRLAARAWAAKGRA
jgi:SAM-dependent methyltransferase